MYLELSRFDPCQETKHTHSHEKELSYVNGVARKRPHINSMAGVLVDREREAGGGGCGGGESEE